jgi:hypothetical protein
MIELAGSVRSARLTDYSTVPQGSFIIFIIIRRTTTSTPRQTLFTRVRRCCSFILAPSPSLFFHGRAPDTALALLSYRRSRTQEGGSEVAPLLHHSDLSLIRRIIDLQAILGEH